VFIRCAASHTVSPSGTLPVSPRGIGHAQQV
jgi:hypothetical protein